MDTLEAEDTLEVEDKLVVEDMAVVEDIPGDTVVVGLDRSQGPAEEVVAVGAPVVAAERPVDPNHPHPKSLLVLASTLSAAYSSLQASIHSKTCSLHHSYALLCLQGNPKRGSVLGSHPRLHLPIFQTTNHAQDHYQA